MWRKRGGSGLLGVALGLYSAGVEFEHLGLRVAFSAPRPKLQAAGESRVVLITAAEDARLAVRVSAELRALKFEVIESTAGPEPPSRGPLEETARQYEAMAAVRLVPSSKGVEVWIVDRVTGKTVLRDIVAEDLSSTTGSAAVALQVVGLLRASLMELDGSGPPAGEVKLPSAARDLIVPPPIQPKTNSPERKDLAFAATLGPGLVVGPGGFGVSGTLDGSLYILRPVSRVGAGMFFSGPIFSGDIQGPEGRASTSFGLVGGGVRAMFGAPEARFVPSAEFGLTAIWLGLDGEPRIPYVGKRVDVFTLAPYVQGGLAYAPLSRLHLRLDLLVGVTAQRPVVKFAERVAAVWGVPFFLPRLSVEIVWH